MLVPSKAMPDGVVPTRKVPRVAPVNLSSLVTLLLPVFVTQMLVPSKARPVGAVPTAKLAKVFVDHLRSATWSGFSAGVVVAALPAAACLAGRIRARTSARRAAGRVKGMVGLLVVFMAFVFLVWG